MSSRRPPAATLIDGILSVERSFDQPETAFAIAFHPRREKEPDSRSD